MAMTFDFQNRGDSTLIAIKGDVSTPLEPATFNRLVNVLTPDAKIHFDLSGVSSITPAGMRMLIHIARLGQSRRARMTYAGARPDLAELSRAAGFDELFRSITTSPAPTHAPQRFNVLPRIDTIPSRIISGFPVHEGFLLPQGATPITNGVNFSIASHHATSCTLVLFNAGERDPFVEIPIPDEFRIGDVYAITVYDLDIDDLEYGFRFDGPFDPRAGHRFNRQAVLLDPRAKSISGRDVWGQPAPADRPAPFRARILFPDFDWQGDRPLEIPSDELIIYEMHVRGFSRHESSQTRFPGTFDALREKIPYLKQLGVNCVELLPIFEFDEMDNPRSNPHTGEKLKNFWGYNTIGFFAPKAGYAATGALGFQADELKSLIRDLHKNGIEVMLDVVFNHTAEGNENGPFLHFRGIDNKIYYMLTPDGQYYNFSGCGNTLNCNHPVVRTFVIDCLRYWVSEFHIDGFRFDLAAILGRAPDGRPLPDPPLLQLLAGDSILRRSKLIAEAWDAGGLYQVGTFPNYGRWAEWNGKYRDSLRKFLKSEPGLVPEVAERVIGSPDLYGNRGPTASVNFITCHDGFTLHDLVSYNDKHNEANGEQNRDGANDNNSWNSGVEGPTDDPSILAQRLRTMKNALAILLASQGIPMLLAGDEFGQTQHGNNNAYCQDSPIAWLDWNLLQKNAELFRFTSLMIARRKHHHALAHATPPGVRMADGWSLDASFHGTSPWNVDWSPDSRALAILLTASKTGESSDTVYLVMNMYWDTLSFGLPQPPEGHTWHIAVNTGVDAPADIWEPGAEPRIQDQSYILASARSVILLAARPIPL
jgi:glycogen operon protein